MQSVAQKEMQSGDFHQAFIIFSELADQGDSDAQRMLSWMYFLGVGVDKDVAEGFERMEEAAESRDPKSLFGLGRVLEELEYYDLARTVFKESTEKKYLPSQYRLARMLRYGLGCTVDAQEAIKLFNEAGKKGHLPSQASKACLLRKGESGFLRRFLGIYQTIITFIHFIILGNTNPKSEMLISSVPPEFNIVIMKREYKFFKSGSHQAK
ncbi:sel1 repeat family protein [Mariprofundus ferrooxydans]|nr:sel1 repeat family protein [Mariprofundus ferrooxydans]